MSFNEIIAGLPNLTENEKRQLFNMLSDELSDNADQESSEFLAILEERIRVADNGGRTHTELNRMRSAEKRQEALRRHHLEQMTGADLTKLPGLDLLAVERILSEIGLDMSRWLSEKHFCVAQCRS